MCFRCVAQPVAGHRRGDRRFAAGCWISPPDGCCRVECRAWRLSPDEPVCERKHPRGGRVPVGQFCHCRVRCPARRICGQTAYRCSKNVRRQAARCVPPSFRHARRIRCRSWRAADAHRHQRGCRCVKKCGHEFRLRCARGREVRKPAGELPGVRHGCLRSRILCRIQIVPVARLALPRCRLAARQRLPARSSLRQPSRGLRLDADSGSWSC